MNRIEEVKQLVSKLNRYRDEYYNKDSPSKGITEVIIAKQRNGPIGTVELVWMGDLCRFGNKEYTSQ